MTYQPEDHRAPYIPSPEAIEAAKAEIKARNLAAKRAQRLWKNGSVCKTKTDYGRCAINPIPTRKGGESRSI